MRLNLISFSGALLALAAGSRAPAATEPSGRPVTGRETVERLLSAMGTALRIEVEAPTRAAALAASEAAARAIEACEARLSTWGETSELARLNRAPLGESLELSLELAAELERARELWRLSGGAFDPTLGGLVRAWDLRGQGRIPSAEELEAARCEESLAAFELEGRRARRLSARLCFEEGGFGKGAGLDHALEALRSAGATRALVDLGGQVALLAPAAAAERGEPAFLEPAFTEIGVAHPDRRDEIVLFVDLESGSLATSGNSERALVLGGERQGHILDPRSARPARDFGSVSVLAPDAFTADALSTACFVLGPDAALELAARLEGIEVLVLERVEGPAGPALRARASAGLAGRIRSVRAGLEPEILSPVPPENPAR